MLRLRHTGRLVGDLLACGVATRAWWLAPVTVALVALLALAAVTGGALPYAMYTLF